LTSLERFDLANRFEKSCNIALTGTSKTSPDYIPGESKLQHPVVNAKITVLSDPRRRLEMRQNTSQKLMVAKFYGKTQMPAAAERAYPACLCDNNW